MVLEDHCYNSPHTVSTAYGWNDNKAQLTWLEAKCPESNWNWKTYLWIICFSAHSRTRQGCDQHTYKTYTYRNLLKVNDLNPLFHWDVWEPWAEYDSLPKVVRWSRRTEILIFPLSEAIKRLTPRAVLSIALKLNWSGHVFWLLAQKTEIEIGLEIRKVFWILL